MPKSILDSKIKHIIEERNKNKKKISESLAVLEQELFDAIQSGNKRKSDSIKKIINRLKKMAP